MARRFPTANIQAAIKLLDWTPISTSSDINSSWEFFQRNLLSLMHRFITSHLQLSYPSSHPWYTEACGEAVGLKQLAFASWKTNPTEGNLSSFHKASQQVCVYPEESQETMFLISSLNSQTCLPPPSPGCIELCLFLVYVPPPLPQMAAQLTLHVKRLNA